MQMKYNLRNIIVIVFVSVCIYIFRINDKKDNNENESNIIKSNAKFLRSIDADANELSRIKDAIKDEMNEASGVNEIKRMRDAISKEIEESLNIID